MRFNRRRVRRHQQSTAFRLSILQGRNSEVWLNKVQRKLNKFFYVVKVVPKGVFTSMVSTSLICNEVDQLLELSLYYAFTSGKEDSWIFFEIFQNCSLCSQKFLAFSDIFPESHWRNVRSWRGDKEGGHLCGQHLSSNFTGHRNHLTSDHYLFLLDNVRNNIEKGQVALNFLNILGVDALYVFSSMRSGSSNNSAFSLRLDYIRGWNTRKNKQALCRL